jgi:hypothetical protein
MANTPKRRIRKARVTRIALCKNPVNELGVLVKSKDCDQSAFSIAGFAKAGIDGTLIGVVYAPEMVDAEGDIASADVIQESAWDYMRNSRALEIEHGGAILKADQVSVVESFIVSKAGDARLDSILPRDKQPGAWAVVLQIDDPVIKQDAAKGDIAGLSMFGDALFERVTKSLPVPESETMNEAQIAALVKALSEATATAVAAELAKSKAADQAAEAAKAAELAKAKADADAAAAAELANAPKFEGDPSDQAALDAFEKSLRAHEMKVALSKAKTAAEVATIRKSFAPKDGVVGSGAGSLSKAQEDALLTGFIKGTLAPANGNSFTIV